ncbi:MAG: ABC transporter ATP-binding protein, partial [Oleiphilaceae bacterium]|nr:ABC transporter ATP-binding protein [Oleiphilaceae bacterium]
GDIPVTQAGYYGIPAAEARSTCEHYLKQLGLWEKRDQPSRMLSGGMKRRLMIARALIHKPRLLILDEPTAGVDIELRRSMWRFLEEINREGTTIILTTHYLEEAEALCRNIAIIDKGRILENTSKKNLLAKLHTETFVLDLEQGVSEVPELAPFEVRVTKEGQLEVEVDRDQNLNQLFHLLEAKQLKVKSLRAKANRLEELFISLVEKGLPEGQQEASA